MTPEKPSRSHPRAIVGATGRHVTGVSTARRTARRGVHGADRLARTLMLLHEGALVAHGLGIFPDAIGLAREQARTVLAPFS